LDVPLQLNEALFSFSGGIVLKPPHLLSPSFDGIPFTPSIPRRLRISVHLGGVSHLDPLINRDAAPYVEVYAYHKGGTEKARSKSPRVRKGESVEWDEVVGDWEVEDDGLVFLR
jgi:hypothetical protein